MTTKTRKINRTKVTVEDCIMPGMHSRFDLVFFAARRAKAITLGSTPLIDGFSHPLQHATLLALEEFRHNKFTIADCINGLSNSVIDNALSQGKDSDEIDVKDIIGTSSYDDFNISEQEENDENINSTGVKYGDFD